MGEQRLPLRLGQGGQRHPQGVALFGGDNELVGPPGLGAVNEQRGMAPRAVGISCAIGEQVARDHDRVPEGRALVEFRPRIQNARQGLLDDVLCFVPISGVRPDVRAQRVDEVEHIGHAGLGSHIKIPAS